MLQRSLFLKIGKLVLWNLTVGNVPAKGTQFHEEHHLRASNVDNRWIILNLALDMADGHVSHQKEKAEPWHVRTLPQVLCNAVYADRADGNGAEAEP